MYLKGPFDFLPKRNIPEDLKYVVTNALFLYLDKEMKEGVSVWDHPG